MLAERIRKVLADRERVRVTRPSATAELRVRDLHDAIEEDDVRRAVASATGCNSESVTIGPIRATGRGLGTAWVRCPIAAANTIASAGKLKIGWTKDRLKHWRNGPSSASSVWVRAMYAPNVVAAPTDR